MVIISNERLFWPRKNTGRPAIRGTSNKGRALPSGLCFMLAKPTPISSELAKGMATSKRPIRSVC